MKLYSFPSARRFELRSALLCAYSAENYFLFAVPKRLRAFRNCLFTRGAGTNSLSQNLTVLPAPSEREPLAQPPTLHFSRKLYRHAKGPIPEGAGCDQREQTGGVPFSSTKTTLWFAIFVLAWYNSRIKYCVYGKLGNRIEWQRKNENQRNGVLLPAVKRQNSGSRQGLAPCSAACC